MESRFIKARADATGVLHLDPNGTVEVELIYNNHPDGTTSIGIKFYGAVQGFASLGLGGNRIDSFSNLNDFNQVVTMSLNNIVSQL